MRPLPTPRVVAGLRHLVTSNRLKFVARWMQDPASVFLKDPTIVADLAPRSATSGSLALYIPYPLTPGGGERYLLTIAATYGRERRCVLFTPERTSRVRLLTLARELELDLDHVAVAPFHSAGEHERFDLFVCMGNEVLPPVAAIARRNLFHCQFPFPMEASHVAWHWRRLDGYDSVIVNSAFTADHVRRAMDRHGSVSKDVLVVPPPVPQRPRAGGGAAKAVRGAVRRILSVGRFAPGGHCKRQDAMIAGFRQLQHGVQQPLELHLAGAVGADPSARDHLQTLIEAARDLPVRFHVNPSAAQLNALYADAELY